jgi:hypothetical protein
MRKKPRFHSLKKLVSSNELQMDLCPDDTDVAIESQTGLVTLVAIQYITTEGAEHDVENILPAEMVGQVGHACIPRRADPGEEVEASLQEKPTRSGANGPQILG